jgi:O-antigen/teichoic acid export membrane protein
MSRSKRFLGGLGLGYSYQALVMLAALWLTPFLLKHIGQHDYGLWLTGLQILSYLMLMDFGIVALLPRETAYATGRMISGTEGRDLPGIIGRVARVVLYQTPLVALAVAVFLFAMPARWHEFRGPVAVVMISFAALFPARIFQAVLHGLQDTVFLGRVQMLGWILSTVLTVVLVLRGFSLYALAFGWLTAQVLSTALCYFRLRGSFPEVLPSRLPGLSARELFSSLTSGFWVSASQVAQVLVAGTDFVLITRFLGPSAVVPYACTQKLIAVLGNQPYMIMEVAGPGLSQMKTSESRHRIFQVSSGLTLGMLALAGAVACVTLAVNHSFVRWWLPGNQFGGAVLTGILVASMLLRHWNTTTVYSLFALGYERRISVTTLIDGFVTLSAGAVLVRWLGPIGAPIGSLVGVCAVSLPANLWALAREVQVSVLKLLGAIYPWFWRFAIVAVVSVILGLRWRGNLPYIAGTACFTAALYAAVMLPMIMDSGLREYIPRRFTEFWESFRRRLTFGPPVTQDPVPQVVDHES